MPSKRDELIAGRYRLVRSLGTGGMGRVWLARDETLRRDVAMKEVLLPEHLSGPERDELKARTLREARAAARLSHPNVVQIYDVVRGPEQPWIVMEYVPAVSLHQLIKESGPLPPQRAAQIGLAMLGALQAAHRNGVLHRDVKPSNVLIAADGRVVLTDFGLATFDGGEGAVTRPGLILGSPQYVAPERAREGVSTPEADLWSLGATLYAAVEGKSPYHRSSAMATLTALATRPPDPSTKAGALRPVLNGLLRKNPRARLTADTVEPLLRRVAGEPHRPRLLPRPRAPREELVSTDLTPPPPTGSPRRSGLRTAVALSALALVILVGLVLFRTFRPHEAPSTVPTPVEGETTGFFAPPPTSVSPGDVTVPDSWRLYTDPAGWQIGVPDGWRYSVEEGWVFFRQPDGSKLLCIELLDTVPADLKRAAEQRERDRLASGELRGYRRIGLAPSYLGSGGQRWEYTYLGTDGSRVHESELLLLSGGRAFRVQWRTPDLDWGSSQDIYLVMTASFKPMVP